jgi:hypothetical protein
MAAVEAAGRRQKEKEHQKAAAAAAGGCHRRRAVKWFPFSLCFRLVWFFSVFFRLVSVWFPFGSVPAMAAAWLAADGSKRKAEVFYLCYSPCWMAAIAAIVGLGLFERFDGLSYLLVGLVLALPVYVLPPLLWREPERPFWQRYWVKAGVWLALFAFIGNHFLTYYFFNVLGCAYTVPTEHGRYAFNGIPWVMHLLTVRTLMKPSRPRPRPASRGGRYRSRTLPPTTPLRRASSAGWTFGGRAGRGGAAVRSWA